MEVSFWILVSVISFKMGAEISCKRPFFLIQCIGVRELGQHLLRSALVTFSVSSYYQLCVNSSHRKVFNINSVQNNRLLILSYTGSSPSWSNEKILDGG